MPNVLALYEWVIFMKYAARARARQRDELKGLTAGIKCWKCSGYVVLNYILKTRSINCKLTQYFASKMCSGNDCILTNR